MASNKMSFLIKEFNKSITKSTRHEDIPIKWSSSLVTLKKNRIKLIYDEEKIINAHFRPFIKKYFYSDKHVNDRLTRNHLETFGNNLNKNNYVISWNRNDKEIFCLASKYLSDLHFTGDSQCFALYQYDDKDNKHENITDWALNQFQTHYKQSKGKQITKQDIFYYVYAVLHSPVYRRKYEQNLKREFPRLPFYADFFRWRDWGAELMDLHINYETQEPFPLTLRDEGKKMRDENKKKQQVGLFTNENNSSLIPHPSTFIPAPRTKLSADKQSATIHIDSQTDLSGVPPLAWEYKLGNRSAIEWILDQYKEKKPKDATIAGRFNTYKFEDYKEQVIDLIKKVTTVSVKTMEIINQMPDQ